MTAGPAGSSGPTDEIARELARLAERVTSLNRQLVVARATARDAAARQLVLLATLGLFLSLALSWFIDSSTDDTPRSGWGLFGALTRTDGDDPEPALIFAGWYSIAVVLVAGFAALGVSRLRRRWPVVTLSVLLSLLALGHLGLLAIAHDVQQLPGWWTALGLMVLTAVAWAHLAARLRELEFDLA